MAYFQEFAFTLSVSVSVLVYKFCSMIYFAMGKTSIVLKSETLTCLIFSSGIKLIQFHFIHSSLKASVKELI